MSSKLPTLEQVAVKMLAIHEEVRESEKRIVESTALTDELLMELQLQISFMMKLIVVERAVNGGLADAAGNVQKERVNAAQLYANGGREKLVAELEARRAACIRAEQESDATGSKVDPDAIEASLTERLH